MDTEVTGFEEFRHCLVDLERVNLWTMTYRPMMRFMDRLLVDGLIPRTGRLWWSMSAAAMAGCSARSTPGAAKHGVAVDLTGVDMNPWSAAASTEATAPGRPIHWVTANAFDYRPEGGIDLIVSSQFTHHLDDDSLVHFLAWMKRPQSSVGSSATCTAIGCPIGFSASGPASPAGIASSRMTDRLSIARSFVSADWRKLIDRAGIPAGAAAIEWWIPFRLCVARTRN